MNKAFVIYRLTALDIPGLPKCIYLPISTERREALDSVRIGMVTGYISVDSGIFYTYLPG